MSKARDIADLNSGVGVDGDITSTGSISSLGDITSVGTIGGDNLAIGGSAILDGSRNLKNIASIDAATEAAITSAGFTKTPASTIIYVARSTAPSGYLKANGAEVSRTTYADLFAIIGTTFGSGDGSSTFNVPDLRGEFIRGFDDGRGVDTGRGFGSAQADEFKSHSHIAPCESDVPYGAGPHFNIVSYAFQVKPTSNTSSTGGSETRPRNIALLACIKY